MDIDKSYNKVLAFCIRHHEKSMLSFHCKQIGIIKKEMKSKFQK